MRVASFTAGLLLLCSSTIAFAAASGAVALETTGADAEETQAKKRAPSDAQIKQLLIDESIAAYSSNCPCPYNTARNGSRCGGRSAYSREGGEAPLCYAKDVTAEMVQTYRDTHPEN
jgi:hypothetical protein